MVVLLVADRALRLVGVVEDDSDARLGDASLALLVDEFLKILDANLP